MIEVGPFAFQCEVCGSVYSDRDLAGACEVFPAEPETIPRGTLEEDTGRGGHKEVSRQLPRCRWYVHLFLFYYQ